MSELYEKICLNIPTAYLDEILDYLESEYAIFPIENSCNKKETEKEQ